MKRVRYRGAVLLGLTLTIFLVTVDALAERVVLVRPGDDASHLTEVFVRLQGELRMHGFEATLASTATPPTFVEMQRIATLSRADACVSFEVVQGLPTVHLWFIDRLTNTPQTFSFTGSDDPESSSELPVRTVEILRSGVLERGIATNALPVNLPPSTTVLELSGSVRPVDVTLSTRQRPFSARFVLGPSFGALTKTPFFKGEFSVGYHFKPRLEVAAFGAIPWSRASLRTTNATARYSFYEMGMELRVHHPLGTSPFHLEYDAGVAAVYVSASAEATTPWVALRATGWTAMAQLGVGVWYDLTPYLAVGGLARLGYCIPKTVVEVGAQQQTLGRPNGALALGLATSF